MVGKYVEMNNDKKLTEMETVSKFLFKCNSLTNNAIKLVDILALITEDILSYVVVLFQRLA